MNAGCNFNFDDQSLAPLIEQVVRETLRQLTEDNAKLHGDRLAWGEDEAAALLGLHGHQLRDARLRGEIQASVGPGRRILYLRQDLLDYLASRRWSKA